MSFSIPYIFKNGVRKKREYAATQQCLQKHPPSSMSSSSSSSGMSNGEGKEPSSYPTLVSMIQSKTGNSPNPSPTSSTSSRSRPTSIAACPSVLPEPEELEENRFYRYIRSHFNLIFSRSLVVCIPHSKSLEGLVLTKDFIETHSYNPSPYYRGQYQAANGKVISIELPIISTVSGFKEPRTVHVLSEEWVYLSRKKIQIYMIERPLEGEPPPLQPHNANMLSIPTTRCSKTDLDFLNMFPENAEALHELQLSVQKFADTYVYIRGFNAYTVDKIQHMYTKTWKTILQRNKLLRDTCRVQSEHDHFLELVENVVMGFLHEKIWIQSLRSILQSQDNYLDAICRLYAKESITLNRYAVSHPMADMPLECFQSAIAHLRKVDTDAQQPISATADEERSPGVFPNISTQLAFTPLEKLICVRKTLDLISAAVTEYVQSTTVDTVHDSSIVNTDEMIPLFAYILVHSHISRIASLAFYMEYFRLSPIERSEHNFALVTLKAAMDFLKGDPLALHDASSGISTLSTNSTSSTVLSPKITSYRTRSTSFGSPIPSPAVVAAPTHQHPQHYRSVSMSSQTADLILTSPRLRHRKSHSADLRGVMTEIQGTTQHANNRHDDQHHQHHHHYNQQQADRPGSYTSSSNSRRNSLTPSVVVRPPIMLSSFQESNRRSIDIPNEWMTSRGKHSRFSPPPPTSHPTSFSGRPSSFATPKISHTRPIISTTFPTISNSSPLPGHSHDTNNTNTNSSCHASSPASPCPVLIPDPSDKSPETRRLARSLSSTSTMLDKRLRHPPEVINLRDRDAIRRPASICIDPRGSMRYQSDDGDDDGTSDDLMGDFLRGLQTLDGDIVGEASGSYRTVRRL